MAAADTDVYAVRWAAADGDGGGDAGGGGCRVTAYGKTPDGRSACVHVRFTPYFFVEMPEAWSESRVKLFIAECCRKYDCIASKSMCVRRKSLWGYQGERLRAFAQLAFDTLAAHRRARYSIRRDTWSAPGHTFVTYEAGVDPLVRLFHLRNVVPCGWFRVTNGREPERSVSTADVELECALTEIGPSPLAQRPPLVFASWDLECVSATGKFPVADNPHDHLIQISTTFQRYGEPEPYHRAVTCFRETAPVEGVEIMSFDTEHEGINAWAKLLRDHSVDVMCGYNIFQFDWRYVSGRAEVLVDDDTGERLVDLEMLGRAQDGGGAAREFELNSNAYGQNKFFVLDTPGVQQIDLLQILRKEVKLPSYSLDNVSKTYLGDHKLDLPAAEIFRKFDGTPGDRADIARYAVRDTELPLRLMAKLSTWENLTEMANAVRVPMDYLLNRGQQIKVFSALLGKARAMGFLVPDDKAIGVPEGVKYEGATVLQAKRGAYFDVVATLDYASLYPSIIRAHNLCYSTLVMDDAVGDAAEARGVEFETVVTGLGTFRFAQSPRGVVPSLLEDLAMFRKQAKKDMAVAEEAGDAWTASLCNARQLAFKITMNSAYGAIGATKGMMPCVPIAASVTSIGRSMIHKTKEMAEALVPGSEVVYGDSVAGYTPVVVRFNKGPARVTTIERLSHDVGAVFCVFERKEHAETVGLGLEVWSEAGWTTVERIIRHRVDKPMMRVVTSRGLVDVTTDHSLLRADGTPVKPTDVRPGDALMHAALPPSATTTTATTGLVTCPFRARIMGMFFGAGTANTYRNTYGLAAVWKLDTADARVAATYADVCRRAYRHMDFGVHVLGDGASATPTAVVRAKDLSRALATEYAATMYSPDRHKIVPIGVLAASEGVRREFWRGLCDSGCGTCDTTGLRAMKFTSHISAQTLVMLAASLGYAARPTTIDTRTIALDCVVATADGDQPTIDQPTILSVRKLPYHPDATIASPPAYVYDLTTANHHFGAGVGTLVVHNTDSVMVKFNVGQDRRYDMHAHFEVATRVAAEISKTFKPPNELEMEKTYFPYLLFSKKRYAGKFFFMKSMKRTEIVLGVVTAYAVVTWLDHVLGTGAYRAAVAAVSRALCRRFGVCDADRNLWLLVALSMGASASYIALALQLGP